MSTDSNLVDIAAELRHETPKAFLFFNGAKEFWLPKSMVEYDIADGILTLPEWLAKREGLI
jgi:hypothetical protein